MDWTAGLMFGPRSSCATSEVWVCQCVLCSVQLTQLHLVPHFHSSVIESDPGQYDVGVVQHSQPKLLVHL